MHHHGGYLAEEAVKEELHGLAPDIPLVPTSLSDGQGGRYYELEIRCGGDVFETVKERCEVCGYTSVNFPRGPYALSRVSDQSLFRDPGPTAIFAHERLRPFLERELGPSAEFIPAPLVS